MSQCAPCSSSTGFCSLNREQGVHVVSEYEPQRASEESETFFKPSEAKVDSKAEMSLPANFEYVPDSPNQAYRAERRKETADSADFQGGAHVLPKPAPELQAKLSSVVEGGLSDVRQLETLLEEARQACLDVPEVSALQRRVRALHEVSQAQESIERLAKALEDARASGVPDSQLAEDAERLQALREERRRQQPASSRAEAGRVKRDYLRKLVEGGRGGEQLAPEKLSMAISAAEREGAAAEELVAARKLLADLQAKKTPGRGLAGLGRRSKA